MALGIDVALLLALIGYRFGGMFLLCLLGLIAERTEEPWQVLATWKAIDEIFAHNYPRGDK